MTLWSFKIRIIVCLLVYLIWTVMCLTPVSGNIGIELINDKLAHFIGNMGLTGALLLAYKSLDKRLAFVGVVTHSFLIEFGQYFIPSRFFSWADMLANVLGVLAGVCLIMYLNKRAERGYVFV